MFGVLLSLTFHWKPFSAMTLRRSTSYWVDAAVYMRTTGRKHDDDDDDGLQLHDVQFGEEKRSYDSEQRRTQRKGRDAVQHVDDGDDGMAAEDMDGDQGDLVEAVSIDDHRSHVHSVYDDGDDVPGPNPVAS